MLDTIDIIMRFFWLLSQTHVVMVAALVSFVLLKRRVAAIGIAALLTSMLLNFFLKELFKIPPVYPFPGLRYAFPSGHTFTPLVFWGWMIFNTLSFSFAMRFILTSILGICIGTSLVYFKYHVEIDVAGAVVFGLSFLLMLYAISKTKPVEQNPSILIAALVIISSVCYWQTYVIAPAAFTWFMSTFIFFTVGFALFQDSLLTQQPNTVFKKAALVLCLFFFAVIWFMAQNSIDSQTGKMILWGCLGFGLPTLTSVLQTKFN